jgi:hypothetical protein
MFSIAPRPSDDGISASAQMVWSTKKEGIDEPLSCWLLGSENSRNLAALAGPCFNRTELSMDTLAEIALGISPLELSECVAQDGGCDGPPQHLLAA